MNRSQRYTVIIPVAGFFVFAILYLIAASSYPGGSEADPQADNFSWRHNYWCDLLEKTSENGLPNMARPFAISGMAVLCLSLIMFWYIVPRWLLVRDWMKGIIRISGIVSMCTLVFLDTNQHDIVINIAVLSGLTAMTFTLYGLSTMKHFTLLTIGLLCLLLCVANTYIYYSQNGLNALAAVQKITFFIFLLWFCLVLWRLPEN